jgi:hypothetical protein
MAFQVKWVSGKDGIDGKDGRDGIMERWFRRY